MKRWLLDGRVFARALAICALGVSTAACDGGPGRPIAGTLPSEVTVCAPGTKSISYSFTLNADVGDMGDRGRPVELEILAESDGFALEDNPDVDPDGAVRRRVENDGPGDGFVGDDLHASGALNVTCSSASSSGVVMVLATAIYPDGLTFIHRVYLQVTCVVCDGGVDGGVDAGADGGVPFVRPADLFVSAVIPDPPADCADSAGEAASTCEPDSDQRGTGSEVETQDQAAANGSFNDSTYECGEEVSGMRTVCSSAGVLPMPEGELVTILMDLDGPVPLASGDTSYVYAAVLDSDGDPANDFVPLPAYPWDYYQATDRWYELIYSHTTGAWTVKVTQLDAAGARTEVASSVRAVIEGSRVRFFIARGELPARVPAYRTTSFRHDGVYTQSTRGGDVPFADPTRSLLPLGCDYTGVECGAGALAACGADHQCATEASRGVCIPMGLSACGGLLPECPSGQTCLTEGDAIGAPAYCVTDAMLDCICAAAAGRHVFPGCP